MDIFSYVWLVTWWEIERERVAQSEIEVAERKEMCIFLEWAGDLM